jgi:DNA-binding transcriptional regulator GbsR (MarR family)
MEKYNEKITFTAEELEHFSRISPITINELSKFIESKTGQQYVIVRKDFVKAISKQLFDNTLRIYDINNFLNEIWVKVVSTNQSTTDKWKEELKQFEN